MVAAIVGGAAALGSAAISSSASKKAANAQSEAADKANATQLEMYNQTRKDLMPYNTTGTNALYSLGNLFGLNNNSADTASGTNPGAAGTVNSALAAFQASPEYTFAFDQGQKALDRSAAAKGLTLSGGQVKAAQQYGQGYASQQFGDYVNRLMGLAGLGQNAAAQTGANATATGQGVASNYLYSGNAQASGIAGSASGMNNALSQLTASTYGAPNVTKPGNMFNNNAAWTNPDTGQVIH